MILGIGVGVADGLYDRSPSKVRNGLIGGAIGGLTGGFLLDFARIQTGGAEFTGRAIGFVSLGLFVGSFIGLVQYVFKDAWLTVIDGSGIGRQLILARGVTPLGNSARDGLSFAGRFGQLLAAEHARIVKSSHGEFEIDPIHETAINGQTIYKSTILADGDIIRLGNNYIRFNSKRALSTLYRPTSSQVSLPENLPIIEPKHTENREPTVAADNPQVTKSIDTQMLMPIIPSKLWTEPSVPVTYPVTPSASMSSPSAIAKPDVPIHKNITISPTVLSMKIKTPPPTMPVSIVPPPRCPECGGTRVLGNPGLRICSDGGALS
jgi:hypothetical protein